MGYCRICPQCGAHLDPGERCDCEEIHQHNPGASIVCPSGNFPWSNHDKNTSIRTVYTGRSFTND